LFLLIRYLLKTHIYTKKLNFFICQILSIVFGFLLRAYCPPRNTNTFKRHIIEISVGFTLIYLCYGSQVSHLLYQAIPSYLMMVLLPPHLAQYGVLLFTMAYLSGAHITRMLSTDLRNSVVDVTLSSIAFNLYDGDILKRGQKTAERPRLLHLLSYLLCYQNSMVGPFVFFSDYLCFIEGREEDQVTTEEDRDLFVSIQCL
uniref:Mannosyltransferase n=1 Tax=Schistocephalus solidus TaxID=70667 RepID=A0A183TBY1_SCHSO